MHLEGGGIGNGAYRSSIEPSRVFVRVLLRSLQRHACPRVVQGVTVSGMRRQALGHLTANKMRSHTRKKQISTVEKQDTAGKKKIRRVRSLTRVRERPRV